MNHLPNTVTKMIRFGGVLPLKPNSLWALSTGVFRGLHTTECKSLQITPILWSAPMKKKRKLDPAVLKIQSDRRKRRLEKQIKRAQRFGRKPKPVDELELFRLVNKEAPSREIDMTPELEEIERTQQEVTAEWRDFKTLESIKIHTKFQQMINSQEEALEELKLVDSRLYELAIKKDDELLPLTFVGPCETPPKPGYIRDGQYTETTNSYESNPEIVKLMLEKNAPVKKKKKSEKSDEQ